MEQKSLAGILSGVTVALTLLAGCTATIVPKKTSLPSRGGERCEERDVASAGDADRRQTFNGSHHGPCPRHLPDLYPRSTMVKLKPTLWPLDGNGSRHELRLPDLRRV